MDQQREKELFDLLDAWCEGQLTPDSAARLDAILQNDADARWQYLCYMELHGALQLDPATLAQSAMSGSALAVGVLSEQLTLRRKPPRVPFRIPHSAFPISALAAAVVLTIGLLAYTFWPGPAQQTVVKQTPAAKIANLTDAKWEAAFSLADDSVLTSGQRLILQSGSAEITFNSQARVIVSGPAELTIVDAAACRLSDGKLTAHVPDPAKGFQVYTPDGTVTDLGTEFGIYVDARTDQQASREEEQQPGGGPQQDGKQPPITEVHVFKGKVEVAPGDQLAQTPTSPIPHPQSTILQAGQAVAISVNKVKPLPAADPFKFALDKLQGKPRKVLLSEDFETYDEGNQLKAIGPWIVQGGTRKGQGVSVGDLAKAMAESNALQSNPSFAPPPAVGVRSVDIAASAQNPTDTFPLLAREIDGRQLSDTCQVLIEFDLMPSGQAVQPSLALATEVAHTAGIELWHDADPAVPPVEWIWNQPYRVRVLLDVVKGAVRAARVQRSMWRGQEGWVFDRTFHPPIPKLDWATPPRYVILGYPVVTATTPPNHFWLDNIRIEVISEK